MWAKNNFWYSYNKLKYDYECMRAKQEQEIESDFKSPVIDFIGRVMFENAKLKQKIKDLELEIKYLKAFEEKPINDSMNEKYIEQ